MIDINTALQNILKAVYGRDVRQSIHDAISQINDNALESLDLAKWNFGTDVTEPTSPVEGYTEGAIYFNTTTGIIWRLGGGAWQQLGNMKTINGIEKTGTSGNVDTYTINFNDGTSTTYTVTNGQQGVSVTNITKTGTTGNVDNYAVNLSNGQTTPNGFSVANGISISNVELDSTVGTTKNYKVKLSDGSYTPNGFTVNNGTSSYVHIRYSSAFDGAGMVVTPTEQTVYIGICVTTQSNAPTDPAVYNWVRFVGQSGSGSGDMLKTEYATTYAGTVDKAVALYDGVNEISATQLMKKDEYDTNGLAGTVDKATKLVDVVNGIEADTQVLAKFSENDGELQYNDLPITAVDEDTITRNDSNELTLAESVTTKLQNFDDDTNKLKDSALTDVTSNRIIGATRRTRRNITSNLANLPTAIAEQDLEKYGYTIGDYFVGASGYVYYLADMNTNYGGYANQAVVSTPHCGIVVDTKSTCQWLSSGTVTSYSASTLHAFLNNTALPNIKNDIKTLFGNWENHLIARTELDNAVGGWGTTWAGLANCLICAMTEVQVYSARVFGVDGHQTGTGSKPLELFRKFRFNEIFGNVTIWLKSLYSASSACLAANAGLASDGGVAASLRASGLILFH